MEQMKKLKQNLLATSLLLGAVTCGGQCLPWRNKTARV